MAAIQLMWAAVLRLVPSEGWTAELAVGLWFIVPTTGFEPTRVDPTRFETLCL